VGESFRELYEENGRDLYEGRKEIREKNFSLYHSSYTFFIIHAYVTFKTFVCIINST
jgi:hypothetical protein